MSLNISEMTTRSGMQKPTALLDTTFELFGFLPADLDPRWPFLRRFHDVKTDSIFKPINFANARAATYLSHTPSFQAGFVTTPTIEHSLQLERALDNLEARQEVKDRFRATTQAYESHDMRLALTDRLTSNPVEREREVTPCPEALFQIRLFQTSRYLARVGFNVHQESDVTVVSIVNIQGRPDGRGCNQQYEDETGANPFNLLVQRVISMTQLVTQHEARGLIDPRRGNSKLYWGVLSSEGVPLFHAPRKEPAVESLGFGVS